MCNCPPSISTWEDIPLTQKPEKRKKMRRKIISSLILLGITQSNILSVKEHTAEAHLALTYQRVLSFYKP
jgi:hypothetical protein